MKITKVLTLFVRRNDCLNWPCRACTRRPYAEEQFPPNLALYDRALILPIGHERGVVVHAAA